METKIVGKRHSKRTIRIARTDEEIIALFQQMHDEEGEQLTTFGGWAERVARIKLSAGAYLESIGLPNAPRLYKWGKTTEWSITPPPENYDHSKGFASRSIATLVADIGYERDSQADLAARLILNCQGIESCISNSNLDVALMQAIELGELITLWRVYGVESKRAGISAGKKGETWRQAAIDKWNDSGNAFKSLPEFCQTLAGRDLIAEDSEKPQKAPSYTTVYRFMLEAKKSGKLKKFM